MTGFKVCFFEQKILRLKIFLSVVSLIILFMSGIVSAQENLPIDSRVTVIVLEDNGGRIIHNELATNILNAKLLDMGFKHVVDAGHVINFNNAKLLDYIYRADDEEFERFTDNVIDYLVLVKSSNVENDISIFDYDSGMMIESPLKSVKNILKVNVIVYDTGEIIGAFNSEGIGFANNLPRAGDKAVEIASKDAAEKLAAIFKNFGSQKFYQLSLKIFATDEKILEQILDDLNSISAIKSMHIYERYGRSAVLSIDSYQPIGEIVKQLKNISALNIFIDRMSGSSCELIISSEEESTNEKNFDDVTNSDDTAFGD